MDAQQFEKRFFNYSGSFAFILFVLCLSVAILVGCGLSMDTSHHDDPAKLIITAFMDNNSNKQKDVTEAGIPGWEFVVNGPEHFVEKTGQNGTIVREVKAGSYQIVTSRRQDWISTTGNAKSLRLSLSPGETKQIDFGFKGPQYIVAFQDINGNGKFDAGEPRLEKRIFNINGDTKSTDKNGQININDLLAGIYKVSEGMNNPEWYNTTASIVNASVPGPDIYFGTSIVQDTLIKEMLSVHNRYRADVNVPPLAWSKVLADHAQSYANRLASLGGSKSHSPVSTRPEENENLAWGPIGQYNFTYLADMWGKEKRYFVNGSFPDVSSTKSWRDVGHYTQMIWQNTTRVGCGLSSGGDNDILVCRYSPPGNSMGQPVTSQTAVANQTERTLKRGGARS